MRRKPVGFSVQNLFGNAVYNLQNYINFNVWVMKMNTQNFRHLQAMKHQNIQRFMKSWGFTLGSF